MDEPYDVYMGRDGPWGNPFVITVHGSRDQVCDAHMKWIVKQPQLLRRLGELRGKRLACYCGKDERCHVDFIIVLVEFL